MSATVGAPGNTHTTAATHTQEEHTMSTITTWLQQDNNRAALWITEPRVSLAYALSRLGAAVSRLGNRIHDEAPGDYSQGQRDGQQLATIYAGVATRTTREDVRGLLTAVNLPCDDDALDRLGWKATA